jgi:hypothetical protein
MTPFLLNFFVDMNVYVIVTYSFASTLVNGYRLVKDGAAVYPWLLTFYYKR